MKNILLEKGQELHEKLCEISDYIYKNPELGNKEYKAVEVLTSFLKEHNFEIEKELLGIETAFRAIYDSKKEGPTIGYLCEYDALPLIGHGCGHNMIGSMSAGAGVILSKVIDKVGGRIIVYGTPAEETNGAKVILAEEGVFDELDVAMMVHPADITAKSGTSMALYPLQFTYKGKTAHAAACPQDGINALNAANVALNAIAYLRETFKEEDAIRVHYVITEGGAGVNSVPDRVVIDMYIRARTLDAIKDVDAKVDRALRGGALAIGAGVEIINTGGYLPLVQDDKLTSVVKNNILKYIDEDKILKDCHSFASGDMGDLSYLLPTVQIGISGFAGRIHGNDFRTDDEYLAYELPIKYFADTVIDLLEDNSKKAKEILSDYESRLTFDQYIKLLNDTNKAKVYNWEV